jgi:hypothetical protein
MGAGGNAATSPNQQLRAKMDAGAHSGLSLVLLRGNGEALAGHLHWANQNASQQTEKAAIHCRSRALTANVSDALGWPLLMTLADPSI